MYIALLLLFSFLAFYYRQKIQRVYGLYSIFRNTVDPEHKKNVCRLCYEVSRIIYMLFCFRPPKLDTFNKKHLKIPYTFRENNYVYLLKTPRGVTPIERITDENGNSVWYHSYYDKSKKLRIVTLFLTFYKRKNLIIFWVTSNLTR